MFPPPNMLQITTILYDKLDVAQKLPRNKKLGYKDHRTLTRHQTAYSEMTCRLLEYIAPTASNELHNYLTNAQRLFCTLNSATFETELSEEKVLHTYWHFIYGPMLACLLDYFKVITYQANTIHSITKLLMEWKPHSASSERARWVKESIKREYDYQTPDFTQLVNDIRGGHVQSREVINKNLQILEKELIVREPELNNEDRIKVISKVAATYHATMVIKRLEENEGNKYLICVKDYLLQLQANKIESDLLILHKKICSTLLQSPNNICFSWGNSSLIRELDSYICAEIKPSYPGFIDMFVGSNGEPCWPSSDSLVHAFSLLMCTGFCPQSPLEDALYNYYQMYKHVEDRKLDLALEYCNKVEEASANVQLGEYRSANLIHKIVLHWLINSQMLHNQFDTEISTLIMTLPDEVTLIASLEPKFQKFYKSLTDNELMYLRSFAMFNSYHKNIQADPFKKLTEVINIAADICNNHQGEINELVDIFKAKISKTTLRSKSVLPFSKRLSLTNSLDMLPDLYSLVDLKDIPTTELMYKLHKFPKSRDIIIKFDDA
ncbi:hypothetical protein [Acinetobacter guillouiae]|uniref:hypothetical protein n=1 Tax=Acinetobacter guillouiae TaxID=106649 RepID=UPI0028EACC44|nr:hypothetical protein [Acinetobacter guillouiae]